MPTRNVNLTADLDRFIVEKVPSGRYENASGVAKGDVFARVREAGNRPKKQR